MGTCDTDSLVFRKGDAAVVVDLTDGTLADKQVDGAGQAEVEGTRSDVPCKASSSRCVACRDVEVDILDRREEVADAVYFGRDYCIDGGDGGAVDRREGADCCGLND